MANLNESPEQFNEKEPRNSAFKLTFNVLNTSTFTNLNSEKFAKSFNTFPDELIFESSTII